MRRRSGGTPSDLQRLIDEAGLLHERLQRVAIALSITEDAIAEWCDGLAAGDGDAAASRRQRARRARALAEECREFTRRLGALQAPQE